MAQQRCRRFAVSACVAAAVVCGGMARAERPAEKKIREELARTTTVEFNEQPLSEVVKYFIEIHGINIDVSQKKLEEANVALDTPITKVLRGVSLAPALNSILGDLGLTYVIENEVLLITSIADAQQTSTPRVYDITGLGGATEREALLKAVELVLDRSVSGPDGKPAPAAMRLLIFREKLLLRGSQAEHDRTTDLLQRLREPPTRPTSVELAPAPATGDAAAKFRRARKRPAR